MHVARILTIAGTTVALTAVLGGVTPVQARPAPTSSAVTAPRDQIQCPRGFVCIYPEIRFEGQPYVKRATDGSVRHLPDCIRGKGSSVINNSSRTARVYQKDNHFGRHVCVGADGGTIADLRSYQLNDTTHSLKNNTTPCGA
ncbi:peptidase inhibitor family I36 protein [Streptomyces virginiae]|uniref:peptidase inhibitor family I36 protein n=1 Tax=Streptomyces virginiae TaxID=1961 RepID=UPI0036E47B80